MKVKSKYIYILLIGLGIGFSGCGSSSDDSSSNNPDTKVYNGAGSRWSLNFKNDGTVKITEADSNLVVEANYKKLPSGFTKIVVTKSNSTNIKVDDTTYGFELPGYMFPFVSFTENKLLPTIINSGECPKDQNHNFIISFAKTPTPLDGNNPTNFNSWGIFGYWEYKSNENKTYVKVYKRDGTINNNFNLNGSIISNCSNGKYYDPVGNPNDPDRAKTTAYFSKNGGIIWQQEGLGPNSLNTDNKNDRVENDFMIPKEPNLNNISQINGNYIGYSISGNGQNSIGYTNTPVYVEINNGTFSVKNIDVESGAVGSEVALINLSTEVSGTKGLWSGTLTIDGDSEGIGCAIDLNANNSSKNVIICGGMYPDGTYKRLYSLILVSK